MPQALLSCKGEFHRTVRVNAMEFLMPLGWAECCLADVGVFLDEIEQGR